MAVASFEHPLVADLANREHLARVVKVALAQEVCAVPLMRAPASAGRHMLQLRSPASRKCRLPRKSPER